MKYRSISTLMVAALCSAALAGCNNDVTPLTLDDATIANDVAATTGDAMATHMETMLGNQTSGTFAGLMAGDPIPMSNATTVNRTTTCYDVNGVVVTLCVPIASVRKVVTSSTINGSRTRTDTINGRVRGFTGAVHRTHADTMTRVFTGATETSRVHNGRSLAHDTTTITEGGTTRATTESAIDSVKAVTWAIPRGTYPISGSIVRVDTVGVVLTKADKTVSRSVIRTVTITFPPDASGNVTMTINGKTCTLNLTTHRVGNCT